MAKKETNIPAVIDNAEALEAKMAAMKEAQKLFAAYTQEQVDKIFKAAATAADKARIPLAKMAVEETGMGVVEDKVIKNHYASEYIYKRLQKHEDMRRYRGRSGLRDQEDRGAYRSDRSSHPDHEPHIHCNLQDSSGPEDKERHHYQSSSPRERLYHRGGEACPGSGGEGGSAGRNHRMDRRPQPGADQSCHERCRYYFGDRRSGNGEGSLLIR